MVDEADAHRPTKRAQYYADNRDAHREAVRRWKRDNPERARELNRLSMRRTSAKSQAAERKRATSRARYASDPERERQRHRRYREQHPERVREYRRRFRERHPERAAEQARRGTQRWHDRNAEREREKGRAAAAARRQDDPEQFKRWYAANLERERERGREASRLRSRLKKLGLPPRRIQRVYADQRRANTAAAEAFFGAKVKADRRRAIEAERPSNDPRRAARERITSPDYKTPPALLARFAAESARVKARADVNARLPRLIEEHYQRHGARIRDEVRMDSIARQMRHRPALDERTEAMRRATREAIEQHFTDPEVIRAAWAHPAARPFAPAVTNQPGTPQRRAPDQAPER